MIYESILDTIGNTPVVKLHRIPPKHVTVYAKIEAFNPLHSVKDRLGPVLGKDLDEGALQPSGLIGSVVGAVIVVLVYRMINRRRPISRRV